MRAIKETIDDFNISSELFDESTLMFDIETLGLSATYCPIYMIGYMCIEEGIPTITLLFADRQKEEYDLLLSFSDVVASHNKFITFNGQTFDIPYIEKRAEINGLYINIPTDNHVDLYRFIRPFKSLLGLNSLRQKAIEENLGLYREDKYDGGYLIGVYHSYENFNNDEDLSLLILHNLEDIKGMVFILPILGLLALKEGSFVIDSVNTTDLGTLVFYGSLPYTIPVKIRIIENGLNVKITGNSIMGTLDTYEGELLLFHKNYKDYCYLPKENTIIPKSLATAIPPDRKTPATKENCYTPVQGYYFKLPMEINGKSIEKKIKSYFNSFDMHGTYLCRNSFMSKEHYLLLLPCKKNTSTPSTVKSDTKNNKNSFSDDCDKKDSPDFSGLSEKIKKILFFFIKEG